MFTIVETPLYIKMVDSLLTKEEQGELHTMISQNPDIGDVVPKSGGVRKVRFARQGEPSWFYRRQVYLSQAA